MYIYYQHVYIRAGRYTGNTGNTIYSKVLNPYWYDGMMVWWLFAIRFGFLMTYFCGLEVARKP